MAHDLNEVPHRQQVVLAYLAIGAVSWVALGVLMERDGWKLAYYIVASLLLTFVPRTFMRRLSAKSVWAIWIVRAVTALLYVAAAIGYVRIRP